MTYQIVLNSRRELRERDQHLAKRLKKFKLTVNEWLMLGFIHEYEPVTCTGIAREFDVSLAYVTVTVDDLVARKLVQRRGSGFDQRVKLIDYTGGTLLDEVEQAMEVV